MSDPAPLARRMPGFDARHATRRARRIRVAVTVVVVLAVVGVAGAVIVLKLRHHAPPRRAAAHEPAVVARVVTTLAPWQLQAPISGAVVLPGATPDELVIAGGSTTGGLTASGVFTLNLTDGTLTQVADLTTTLDDAAGVVLDGQDLVIGGTATAAAPASTVVQRLPAPTAVAPAPTAMPTSSAVGALPQARAAEAAVTAGSTAYVVGGGDAAVPDSAVLATNDGQDFSTVAQLAVPVLFPAVAVVGTRLFVVGGTALVGPDAGDPVNTIQVVDLHTGRVTATGHLPEPLTGAAAAVLGNEVVVAGGNTVATASGTTTSPSSTAAPGTPGTSSVPTVWLLDPSSGRISAVGRLAVAVAYAGTAVVGARAWLVGGASNGTPESVVQSLVLTTPAPTGHRPRD